MPKIRFLNSYNKRLLIIKTIIVFILTSISIFYTTMIYLSKNLIHGERVNCKNCNQDLILTVNNADCIDNKFSSSKLVWPEQLPHGDRIIEQLYYVPKGYNYLKTPLKWILIHTGAGAAWEVPKSDQGEFIGCPVSQCWLTLNKSMGSEVDAVMFRHIYSRPEYQRHPKQIWILLNSETPYSNEPVSDPHVFNWTANYRWDSDIPYIYGYFMKNDTLKSLDEGKNYAQNKTKKVAWFVSNCVPNSNRTMYVRELAKHISIDVYGQCGTFKCSMTKNDECFQMLKNEYKFYLSFENSHCIYYITEKLFKNALSYDVLPIVMGPDRKYYEFIAPKNSFIHVDDFESPKKLADYLHLLDSNHHLYNEYFRWKDSGTVIHDTRFYCRLCAMLHDTERAPRHYQNINEWWRGPGTCRYSKMDWPSGSIEKVQQSRRNSKVASANHDVIVKNKN